MSEALCCLMDSMTVEADHPIKCDLNKLLNVLDNEKDQVNIVYFRNHVIELLNSIHKKDVNLNDALEIDVIKKFMGNVYDSLNGIFQDDDPFSEISLVSQESPSLKRKSIMIECDSDDDYVCNQKRKDYGSSKKAMRKVFDDLITHKNDIVKEMFEIQCAEGINPVVFYHNIGIIIQEFCREFSIETDGYSFQHRNITVHYYYETTPYYCRVIFEYTWESSSVIHNVVHKLSYDDLTRFYKALKVYSSCDYATYFVGGHISLFDEDYGIYKDI